MLRQAKHERKNTTNENSLSKDFDGIFQQPAAVAANCILHPTAASSAPDKLLD
jgi:hypothetical protein